MMALYNNHSSNYELSAVFRFGWLQFRYFFFRHFTCKNLNRFFKRNRVRYGDMKIIRLTASRKSGSTTKVSYYLLRYFVDVLGGVYVSLPYYSTTFTGDNTMQIDNRLSKFHFITSVACLYRRKECLDEIMKQKTVR
jgi:hypothetical protein